MFIKKCLSGLLAVTFVVAAQFAQAGNLPDFSELAAKSGPAVVNINTEKMAASGGPEELFGEMFRNMPPGFEKFFDQFGGKRDGTRPQSKQKISRLWFSGIGRRLYCHQQSCGGRC